MGGTSDSKSGQQRSNSALTSAISGLIVSMVGKSILHPIDTIKAKLQVSHLDK